MLAAYRKLLRDESGATAIEYGLIAALIAVAAIASGGETIAPSAKAAAQGSPGRIVCAIHAIAKVVTSTRPIAAMSMGRRFRRKSRHEVNNAAGYRSAGRMK